MKSYPYYIIFLLSFLSSCKECKEEVCLYPSNDVYVSVLLRKDSIIVFHTNKSDTLLKKGNEIYDTFGRLFMTTRKDTIFSLDNGNTTRWIKSVRENEYSSSTYEGKCWTERSSEKTFTFDSNYNILKIYAPGYIMSYVTDNNILPMRKSDKRITFYYPNRDNLNTYVIQYDKDQIIIKNENKQDETFYVTDDEVYSSDGRIFLSNQRDTTVIYGPPEPPLDGFPSKYVIRPAFGGVDYSTKCYFNPDTVFRFTKEFIYDKQYRIKVIRQCSVLEFVRNSGTALNDPLL